MRHFILFQYTVAMITAQFVMETHVDMECGLGVKVAALPCESVLLVNIITNILQDLAQVLTAGHCCNAFL